MELADDFVVFITSYSSKPVSSLVSCFNVVHSWSMQFKKFEIFKEDLDLTEMTASK